jgi:hypothetical protein
MCAYQRPPSSPHPRRQEARRCVAELAVLHTFLGLLQHGVLCVREAHDVHKRACSANAFTTQGKAELKSKMQTEELFVIVC